MLIKNYCIEIAFFLNTKFLVPPYFSPTPRQEPFLPHPHPGSQGGRGIEDGMACRVAIIYMAAGTLLYTLVKIKKYWRTPQEVFPVGVDGTKHVELLILLGGILVNHQ